MTKENDMEYEIGDKFMIIREDDPEKIGTILTLRGFKEDDFLSFHSSSTKFQYGYHDPKTLEWKYNSDEAFSDVAPLCSALKILLGE